ncbi:MAG: DUF3866 family protein [Bifidobacteriaceae bacterium]|nr:DUF3866 family protein [Bifidobacteriaceae bacterium]
MVTCQMPDGSTIPALCLTAMTGPILVGDRLLLNLEAWRAGLGTGGFALAMAVERQIGAPATTMPAKQAPKLVKARYTPCQVLVDGIDELDQRLGDADSLDGMVVVAADLHSALPAFVAGACADGRLPRIAYIMSDAGALPLALSHSVAQLAQAGLLVTTITAGQAFGGELEAVNIYSALLAACHVAAAEIAIVAPGPGNLGSGSRWGFSGVAAGETINAASVLGGRPVGLLRISGADPRPRHRGLSHHCVTALGRVAHYPCDLVFPDLTELDAPLAAQVDQAAAQLIKPIGIHQRVAVSVAGLPAALADCPVELSSMGRGLADDPACFLSAAAAGRHASCLASSKQ